MPKLLFRMRLHDGASTKGAATSSWA